LSRLKSLKHSITNLENYVISQSAHADILEEMALHEKNKEFDQVNKVHFQKKITSPEVLCSILDCKL